MERVKCSSVVRSENYSLLLLVFCVALIQSNDSKTVDCEYLASSSGPSVLSIKILCQLQVAVTFLTCFEMLLPGVKLEA